MSVLILCPLAINAGDLKTNSVPELIKIIEAQKQVILAQRNVIFAQSMTISNMTAANPQPNNPQSPNPRANAQQAPIQSWYNWPYLPSLPVGSPEYPLDPRNPGVYGFKPQYGFNNWVHGMDWPKN